nr:hypothetical protein [Tanacetum cinerariifolium]GEZ20548.1 hypothetical protein [Tanacetum cinerariifolium]
MDLFGPTSVSSISHKWYCLVVTDDFSRFTWTFFLKSKDETSGILKKFITEIENLKDLKVKSIRRNKTLIEAARTMFNDAKLPVTFWAKAVNTACYVQNRVLGDEGYFIGYSMFSKAFRVFNKRPRRVEENMYVEFLENKAIKKGTKDAARQEVKKDVSSLRYIALPNWAHDALLNFSSSQPQNHCSTEVPKGSGNSNLTASTSNPPADQMETLTMETSIPIVSSSVPTAYSTDSQEPSSDARLISKRVANQAETPSLDNILSLSNRFEDILGGTTNSDESNGEEADISNMETTITASPTPTLRIHKDHSKSQIIDPSWVEAKQEELFQFKIQNVWTLVDCPKGVRPIGTKWVLKNKRDERGIVIKNTAMLVAQGHTQEEGIDYDEVFAPVARIEAIRLFLAYASFMGFVVYQMDVKSSFLYGTIDEEVKQREDFILVQVYVDDIIFGSSNPQLCIEFEAIMHAKFQMSAMGTSKFWGVLRMFMISLRQFPQGKHNIDFHPMVGFIEASPLRVVPLFDAMLVHQGEGLGTPIEPHHTPSPKAQTPSNTTHPTSSLPPVTTTSILTVTPIETTPIRHYTRRTRIAQSSVPLTVADEPASPYRDVGQGEACPNDFGFIADQDRATIAKSSTLPYDSAPRVTSPAAVEGDMQHTIPELTALCTSLQRQLSEFSDEFQAQEVEINRLKKRVKLLEEREGVAVTNFRDDAPIKGRSIDEGEVVAKRVSDDTEEMETVLTSMDTATILASGVVNFPPGSGSIPTASTPAKGSVPIGSEEVPTASLVFATATVVIPYKRRKGKEVMVESETPKK